MIVSGDRVTILGRPVDSHTYTPTLRAWIEQHWRYDEHAVERQPYRILLTEDAAPVDIIRAGDGFAPVDVRLPGQLTLRWQVRHGEWHTDGRTAGVSARFDDGEARIRVWGTTTGDGHAQAPASAVSAAPWPALYVALCEALRASGLVPLHAAVVVRGRTAIAIAGPSGAGKTTTLLRLLDRGWRPLAEDFSWLDPASRTLYGWDRGLRLWRDGLARIAPRFAAAPWTLDRDGKLLLEWRAVPAVRAPQATLARMILLERDAARRSTISSLSPRAAVRVLWEASGVPLTPKVREDTAQHVARLVRTIEVARLKLGTGELIEPDVSLG